MLAFLIAYILEKNKSASLSVRMPWHNFRNTLKRKILTNN